MQEDQAKDSASLLPILTGKQPEDEPLHDFVLYQAGSAYDGAIREGSLVLLVDRNNEATELYDLSNDLAQEHNLIENEEYQETVKRLKAKFLKYNDHNNDIVEPRTTKAFKVK